MKLAISDVRSCLYCTCLKMCALRHSASLSIICLFVDNSVYRIEMYAILTWHMARLWLVEVE